MDASQSIPEYLRAYGPVARKSCIAAISATSRTRRSALAGYQQLKRTPFPARGSGHHGHRETVRSKRGARRPSRSAGPARHSSLSAACSRTRTEGRFTALAMVPPQLVEKWARECFLTLPGVRVFSIDGVRNGVGSNGFTGVNEVRLRNGRIVREGLKTTLSEVRLRKTHRSARARWQTKLPRHRSSSSRESGRSWGISGGTVSARREADRYLGSVVNPDTGKPVLTAEDQLRRSDFRKVKHSETVLPESEKSRAAIL